MDKLVDILNEVYYEGISDHHAPTGLSGGYEERIKELFLGLVTDCGARKLHTDDEYWVEEEKLRNKIRAL